MKTFDKIMKTVFIVTVTIFVSCLCAMAANEFTLEPKFVSRVYSTHEVTESSGWRLVVDGNEYPNKSHLNGFFWDCSNKPERFFRVVTLEGCMGWNKFDVEEIVKNEIRQLVKSK